MTARPLRFAGTGGAAGALQLLLLASLLHLSWDAFPANLTAFLIAAQLNFFLSSTLTWGDRQRTEPILRLWLLFHLSIGAMALLNMLVFVTVRLAVPPLAASGLGIAAAALGNYLAGDRLVFRESLSHPSSSTSRRHAA